MNEPFCASCGRPMQARRRWARSDQPVKYCSAGCRRRRRSRVDRALEEALLALLEERSASATVCPSEAARRVAPDGWRALMEPARRAIRRLAHEGVVEVTQKGRRVDAATMRGPVRVGRGPGWRRRTEVAS